MDVSQIIKDGVTSLPFAILIVYISINLIKACKMGFISVWLGKVIDDNNKYSGRVLLLNIIISTIINVLQKFAMIDSMNTADMILRIITCSVFATGGYEFIKCVLQKYS